jgi:hypothetical protein
VLPAQYTLDSAGEGSFAVASRIWRADAARLHLLVDVVDARLPEAWEVLQVDWEYFSRALDDWVRFGRSTWLRPPTPRDREPPIAGQPPQVTGAGFSDTTEGLRRFGWINAPRPADFTGGAPSEIGLENQWLRATARIIDEAKNRIPYDNAPRLRVLAVALDLAPDAAAGGTDLLDVTAPVLPFGANPQPNATFYVASREAFAQRGARVTMFVSVNPAGRPAPRLDFHSVVEEAGGAISNLPEEVFGPFRLVWEYPAATGWKVLGESRLTFRVLPQEPDVRYAAGLYPWVVSEHEVSGLRGDSTEGLRRSGEIEFVVPQDIVAATVADVESYWIRARLAEGDYGTVQEFVLPSSEARSPTEPPPLVPKLGTGTLQPPVVESVALTYDYGTDAIAPTVLTLNEFRYRDQTAANGAGTGAFTVLEPPEETEPTFYLGFDRKLPNGGVSLFFVVPPRQVVERLPIAPAPSWEAAMAAISIEIATEIEVRDSEMRPREPEGESRLLWQYWNGIEWAPLFVSDDTNDLTESGSLQFLGPADAAALAKFALDERYWIRACVRDASGGYAPRISGVFLNAVDALQSTTIRNELVGSSNGEKRQLFRLAQAPVAPGQRIVVREPERPPEEEAHRLRAEEGEDAIDVRHVEGGPDETWVRWHPVPTLAGSDEKSRHYTLDRITGEVRFGDGLRGLIPPPGSNNIVAELYVAGGTAAGNRGPGAVSQLKSSIPYIAAVTNPITADGGSESETLAGVQVRGPYVLRHAGLALSEDDFEWLAREAVGTRVARARSLSNRDRDLVYRPGWTTLIVVPRSADRKPFPSAQLVREVENFFAERMATALTGPTPDRLNVIGPGYLPVELEVEVKPRSFAEADAVRTRVRDALDRFFQPLTGGPDRSGWPFGRDVYLSEVFAELEGVAGVEHVHALGFELTVATTPVRLPDPAEAAHVAGETFVVSAWGYDFNALFPVAGRGLVGRLVEDVSAGGSDAMLTVFQEGQRIRLAAAPDDEDAPETTILAISGSRLTVEPFRAAADLPVGTWAVTTADALTGATLAAAVTAGSLVETLVVDGLDMYAPLGTGERLRVPPSHLVYSGTHTITATQT